MEYLLASILMVSWTYGININFNTSLVGNGIMQENLRSSEDNKQDNRDVIDSGVQREENKKGDKMYKTTCIFNKFPNKEEQSKLNFIRDMMHKTLGQTKFCNMSYDDHKLFEGFSCQSCSCEPSCHETRVCCPDIQHKLLHTSTQDMRDEAITSHTKSKQVCMTLHDQLYKQETGTISPLKMTREDNSERRSKESSKANQAKVSEDDEPQNSFSGYLVIQSCLETYKNKDIIEKCYDDNPALILDTIPVVDWFTNTIYRNRHCATCNNITEVMSWTVTSDCIELYQNNCPIIKTVEIKAIAQRGKCQVLLLPGLEMEDNFPKCISKSLRMIGSCGKTGLVSEHDKIIKDLCIHPDMIAQVSVSNGSETLVYKNMFCYLCNLHVNGSNLLQQDCPDDQIQTVTEVYSHDKVFPDFEVIINEDMFVGTKQISKSCSQPESNVYQIINRSQGPEDCRQDEVWDVYKNKCRQLICPMYQTPYQQLCIQKQASVRGLIISAQLLVTIPKDISIIVGSDHVNNSEDSFVVLLNSDSNSVYKSNTKSLKGFFHDIYNSIEASLQIHMYLCKTKHIQVLAKSQDKKMKYFIFQIKVQSNYRCSVESLFDLFQEIAKGVKAIPSPDILRQIGISTLHVGLEYHTLAPENFNIKQTILNDGDTKPYEITIKPLFYCPKIQLSLEEYNQSIKTGLIDKLKPHDFDLQFTPKTQTVDICLLTYLKQWLDSKYKISLQNKVTNKAGIESTMSMVATLTSMISTVIVLVTYSIFSELRFVPGKLFMILCVNLLLAQFFFAFGTNDGYSDFTCKFVGIGIHFFWLATIFSMSSCLSLMIHSIKSPMEHNNRVLMQSKSICKAAKYVLITYCAPLLMVVTNLIMASVKQAPHGGYGGDFCYISSNILRIYTFAIPVGVVICINFTMFTMIFTNLIIVIKSNQKSNHQYVLVFLKLTTITGMFWMFGFLYEATQIVCFAYLFTLLNAGQGFFLMWSFILNKRVINLYISKIKKYSNSFHSWNLSNSTGQNSLHKKVESTDRGQPAQSEQD